MRITGNHMTDLAVRGYPHPARLLPALPLHRLNDFGMTRRAVYLAMDRAGRLDYVGSTMRPVARRVREHAKARQLRWSELWVVEFGPTISAAELQAVEGWAIDRWHPPSNRRRNAGSLPPLHARQHDRSIDLAGQAPQTPSSTPPPCRVDATVLGSGTGVSRS